MRLRRNNPRVIPEVFDIAQLSLENLRIGCDVIVQDHVTSYPQVSQFEYKQLDTGAYPAVLRLERGRVKQREIFGPVRLHYGLFKIAASNCHYLIAYDEGRVSGAIGYMTDPVERFARIFELISVGETPICDLLRECIRICREEKLIDYIEIDVSADANRMQRTLFELGFIAAAYLPAFVFHEVERIDVVKMAMLVNSSVLSESTVVEQCQPIANRVLDCVRQSHAGAQVLEIVGKSDLFKDLDPEQCDRVAWNCEVRDYCANDVLFEKGSCSDRLYMLIEGFVEITNDEGNPIARVGPGEVFGEISILDRTEHSASARARDEITVAFLKSTALERLASRRPDIGVVLYRNIAITLSHKLQS